MLVKFTFESMRNLTFDNERSAFNVSRRLEALVQTWRKKRAIQTLIAGHRYRASLKTAKMQACSRISKISVEKLGEKVRAGLKRLSYHGLAKKRLQSLNSLILRKAYQAAMQEIAKESASVLKKQKKITRFTQSNAIKKVRLVFGELKKHWRHIKNLNQLGSVFYKLHGQLAAKRIISIWTKFTFMSEHSQFQMSIKAKDTLKYNLKKRSFKALKQPALDARKKNSNIEKQMDFSRLKRLRSAFRSLASNAVAKTHGKRLELLNKVIKGWRKEVVRIIEEREIDQMVNEEEEDRESIEQENLQRKKHRNERFMWLIMGKDAPPGFSRQIGGRAEFDGEGTDKNRTEFSSEDLAGEDIVTKSAN